MCSGSGGSEEKVLDCFTLLDKEEGINELPTRLLKTVDVEEELEVLGTEILPWEGSEVRAVVDEELEEDEKYPETDINHLLD